MATIGVITEQGDLGLGFDPLNNQDQQTYNEAVQREQDSKKDNSQIINEDKK
jgi:hypothetical protein